MNNTLLDIQDLSIRFHQETHLIYALQGINFTIQKNEVVGLVGESAAGKSVTAQAIMGLLPEKTEIYSGKIFFNDQDLLTLNPHQIRKYQGKKMSMIYQDPFSSLNPTMRVGYQVVESLEQMGVSYTEAKEKALLLFQELGLKNASQIFTQYPHELSGGIRQRIIIAMALITSPELLIADEPTTALDVTIQTQILNLLKQIYKKHKMSILLITHDFGVVSHICDRVLVMYGGKIVEEGTIQEVLQDPKHPYTKMLLQSMPKITDPIQEKIPSIEGNPPILKEKASSCTFAPRCPYVMPICKKQFPQKYQNSPTQKSNCWLNNIHEKNPSTSIKPEENIPSPV